MESSSRLQLLCPCSCYKLGTDSTEFQKILESEDGGLAIYRHVPETNHAVQKRLSETSKVFILRNSKNVKLTREDFTKAFERNKMTCPRCIKIVKQAESLVTNVRFVDGQDVLGVCDHCRMKVHSLSCRCQEAVKKFKINAKEERELKKQRVKKWLTQVQHLLKKALINDPKEDKKRARSEVSFDKLFSKFNKSEPQQQNEHFKEEYRAADKLKTSTRRPSTARTSSSSERVEDAYTDAKEYLKHVIKPPDTSKPVFTKLPQDDQLIVSKSESDMKKTELKKFTSFLETFGDYIAPKPKHKKLGILKTHEDAQLKKQETSEILRNRSLKDTILKSGSEQDVSRGAKTQEFTSKSKTSFEDALSPEMPWLKSASDQDLARDFRYIFPKENSEIIRKHTATSSAELIKDLQDTLKKKTEEEKRKKEQEIIKKREENERERLEKDKKKKIEAEKELLVAKEKPLLEKEKLQLSEKKSPEKADEEKQEKQTLPSSLTTEKAKKEAQMPSEDQKTEVKGQQEIKKGKEEKLQKQKLVGQKSSQNDKEDEKQKEKLEGQANIKKEKDSSKQDKKSDDKEAIKAEKAKITAQKLAEKEAQKSLKEQQKKEKEEKTLKAKNKKIEEQEKLKRDKEENFNQKLKEKESLKKEKDDRLQKDKENTDKTANKDRSRIDAAQIDDTTKEEETAEKDKISKKSETTKKDETMKKDEISKKSETTKKDETMKKDEISKNNETTKQSSGDKKGEVDKLTERAANDQLKALLELQQKEKAEREKLKKQQEIEKAQADKKAKETEKNAKSSQVTEKMAKEAKVKKNKEIKDRNEKLEALPAKRPGSPPLPKDIALKDVKVRKQSGDDLILRLVKLRQADPHLRESHKFSKMNFAPLVIKKHAKHTCKDYNCPICRDSELSLDFDECVLEADICKPEDITDIIIGDQIYKNPTPYRKAKEKEMERTIELIDEIKVKNEDNVMQESPKTVPTKPLKGKNDLFDPDASKGVIRYALSDRAFIDKGWTMLPTEKVVRKMNVYRMRPAHPEFDWFEHNKNKRLMQYDTGEKLAEFDDNGRGRWFYRSGKLALDYYDAEEINAQQRFVVYSSGELDERGRTRPRTILATFDYLGNGIVFDHAGKIRLKYNQTEGVVLDRSIGPVSQWKWHTLNDPPVLQQVMIDTQMPYKDPTILKLGGPGSAKKQHQADNEEMLAIEFDNFIKEKSRKLTQKFKPFQIRMKALKINEYFSLRVLDQATVYLLYRDGTTNLKINMGMILNHKEIVDTDTADVGDVSNSMERLPARTDSLAVLQQAVAQAQREERLRVRHERRLHKPAEPCASVDQLTAATSRPLRPPFMTVSGTTVDSKCPCKLRKPPSNLYYDTRL